MDLISIRRNLLAQVGGSSMIGDFSRYSKQTLTFSNAQNNNEWAKNPSILLPFAPKYIVFYADDDSVQGGIFAGFFTFVEKGGFTIKNGLVHYINLSSGAVNVSGAYTEGSSNGNLKFYIDNNDYLHIDRVSGNGFWSNTYEYTFEFYG